MGGVEPGSYPVTPMPQTDKLSFSSLCRGMDGNYATNNEIHRSKGNFTILCHVASRVAGIRCENRYYLSGLPSLIAAVFYAETEAHSKLRRGSALRRVI